MNQPQINQDAFVPEVANLDELLGKLKTKFLIYGDGQEPLLTALTAIAEMPDDAMFISHVVYDSPDDPEVFRIHGAARINIQAQLTLMLEQLNKMPREVRKAFIKDLMLAEITGNHSAD